MTVHGGKLAIDAVLRARYPRQKPGLTTDGVGPLEEIRVYHHPATVGDAAHWHYVTLGLSELGAKRSSDESRSGWGFELTLRIAAANSADTPPSWPNRALGQLAGSVYATRAPFAVITETLTWQSPIWSRGKVRVSLAPAALARTTLPALLRSRTAHGRPFRLMSGGRTLFVSPGPESQWTAEGSTLQLTVSAAMVDELQAFLATDTPSLSSRLLPGFVLALVE